MKKKLLTFLMTALIVCISSVAFAAINPFIDVPEKHWAYYDVAELAADGIISDDYGDCTFKGNRMATRYEVAVMIANLYAKKEGTTVSAVSRISPYVDIPKNHWAYDAVDFITAYGIEEGYGDATFLGNRNITHGELRTMLNNLFRVTGIDARMKDNPDNENEPITRYELASTLNKVYKALFN
ncbi:MAG: S-layer homology domain-containing protein [Selenomonadaceae bacterium]|nr:S-layer homology domain-containing protein [Selenomonadaceae bacterium]